MDEVQQKFFFFLIIRESGIMKCLAIYKEKKENYWFNKRCNVAKNK